MIITNVAGGWSSHLNTYNALNFATKSRKVSNRPTSSEDLTRLSQTKTQERKLEAWRAKQEGTKVIVLCVLCGTVNDIFFFFF